MTGAVGWSQPGAAEVYAETFAPLCAGTIDAVVLAAGISEGRALSVLDAGTGTGSLAAKASRLGAMVTAVDPDPEMVRVARMASSTHDVRLAGLPRLPFADGAFDVVLANFVINHVPDPAAGLRELARVTARGGRVVVTIWPSGENAQSRLWAGVIADSGAVSPATARLPADKDFARTAPGLEALLAQSGLDGVESESVRWTHRGAPDAFWRGAAAGIGGIGATVTSQSPQVRALMKRSYDRRVADVVVGGRMEIRTQALLAVGTRAQ